MEIFLLFVILVAFIFAWKHMRSRMNEMDAQIARLTARLYTQEQNAARAAAAQPAAPAPETKPQPVPEPKPQPFYWAPPPPPPPVVKPEPAPEPVQPVFIPPPPPAAPVVAPPPMRIIPPAPAAQPVAAASVDTSARATASPKRSSEEWEAMLGGNWLNKIGALVLVIGIALLLGYSFTHLGAIGIVSISLLGSLAMLVAGILFESRERYRVFARGLISGGWAALYVTVYSMHSVTAAKVIENPVLGAVLLIAVAAGMIAHSLRYRSQIVTGFAYFMAFFTLVITQSTPLSLAFMVPLTASLLYLAHRLRWPNVALGGLLATYATCALRPDTGAPLWEAQAIFATFWLLFEIYDIVQADTWLLPLNAVGVLGLSLIKWHRMAPHDVWILLAAASGIYLVDALIRSRRGRWQGAITLSAGLAAAAIFQRLDQQWVASGLVIEAELLYLAGLRLRKPYLRWLGTALFGIEAGRLISDIVFLPVAAWAPVAAADAVVFYANRFLCEADIFFGYGAAAAIAVLVGYEAPDGHLGICWLAAAAVPVAFGWWRKLADIRVHGYLLWILGLIGAGFDLNRLSLASAALFSYALALCVFLLPGEERTNESFVLRAAAPFAATAAIATLIWREAGPVWLGIAWMGASLILMEFARLRRPRDIGPFSMALTVLGIARVLIHELPNLQNHGALNPRLIPALAGVAAYWIAWRSRPLWDRIPPVASWVGTGFLAIAIWALVPQDFVTLAWLLYGALLLMWGFTANLRTQGAMLWALGLLGAGYDLTKLSLSAAAIVSYGLALFALRGWGRMADIERAAVRAVGSLAATAAVATLIWRVADAGYVGIFWIGAAVILMELGLLGWPREMGGFSISLAALGIIRIFGSDVGRLHDSGPWTPRLVPAAAALLTYWIARRSRPIASAIPPIASWVGAVFVAIAAWTLAPPDAAAACWAAYAALLLLAGFRWNSVQLQAQACLLAFAGYGWWLWQLLYAAPGVPAASALFGCAATIAGLFAAQLAAPRTHWMRIYHSLLATTLTGLLLHNGISGRMLTIAWGIQGVALLSAGFPLRDRVLRLSGLAILLFCILKLFVYDLSYLDTLPRIFSFIVLGLILLAVSWVYTRFRDHVARYL